MLQKIIDSRNSDLKIERIANTNNSFTSASKGKDKRKNKAVKITTSVFGRKINQNWYHQETDRDLVKDDRVYIKNKVTPQGRFRNDNDRKSTLIRTEDSNDDLKIYLKTDNGAKTWRLRKYLNKLIKEIEHKND